jgi:hypothetical protein
MDRYLHTILYLLILVVANACTVYQVPLQKDYGLEGIPADSPFKDISLLVKVNYDVNINSRSCKYPIKDVGNLLLKSGLFKDIVFSDDHASYDLIISPVANEETMDCRGPDGTGEVSLMLITLGIVPFEDYMNYKHLFKFVSKKSKEESVIMEFTNVHRTYDGSLVQLLRISDGWSGSEPDYSVNIENFRRLLLANKDLILKLAANTNNNHKVR